MLDWLKAAFYLFGGLYIIAAIGWLANVIPFSYTIYLLAPTIFFGFLTAIQIVRELSKGIVSLAPPSSHDVSLKWVLTAAFLIVVILYVLSFFLDIPWPNNQQFLQAASIFWTVIAGNFIASVRRV